MQSEYIEITETIFMDELEEQRNEIKNDENIKEIVEETIQHLNNPVLDLKPIVKKYLTHVQTVRKEGNRFFFSDGEASVADSGLPLTPTLTAPRRDR